MVERIESHRRALAVLLVGLGVSAWAAAEARASWPHLHLRGASACHQPSCPPAGGVVVPPPAAPVYSRFLVLRYDAATKGYVFDGSHRDMAAAQARALEIIAKGVAAVVLCEA